MMQYKFMKGRLSSWMNILMINLYRRSDTVSFVQVILYSFRLISQKEGYQQISPKFRRTSEADIKSQIPDTDKRPVAAQIKANTDIPGVQPILLFVVASPPSAANMLGVSYRLSNLCLRCCLSPFALVPAPIVSWKRASSLTLESLVDFWPSSSISAFTLILYRA